MIRKTSFFSGYEKAKFNIEFAQLYLIFRHVAKAKEHIFSADDILGVQFSLQGKIAKRTKQQDKDTALLTLELSMSTDNPEIKRPPVLDFELPKNIKAEKKDSTIPYTRVIPNTEQKLFLTRAHEMLVAKPQDDLHFEEIQPFIDLILNQKNTWAVRVATLLLRCKIRSNFKRYQIKPWSNVEKF